MEDKFVRKFTKIYDSFLVVFAGILFVAILSGIVRPIQNDQAHAIGVLTMQGGQVRHPAQYTLGESLFGQFSLVLTAKVVPPVSGDMVVSLSGPEQLGYIVSSRYPPGLPIVNRSDKWYQFDNSTFSGMTSGSNLVIVVKIKSPQHPGKYHLTVTNKKTGQVYLTLPVIFTTPGGSMSPTDEECHE